jgi:enamine deaminase RidA (YjgF/YER057c/UK114 family)
MQAGDRPTNLNPKDLGPPRGFSHVTTAGGMVWVAGQIGSDETGALVDPADVVAQFGRAIRNVVIALDSAGCKPEDTVKLTYFVTDLSIYKQNLSAIGEAYREVFGRHYPATTLVEVSSLFDRDAMVEIEAVAVLQK